MGRAFEYRRAAKEARWGKMSRIFPKLARSITIAAKDGGIDPDMNPRLRTAIAAAKAQNMPKDNIDAAIKRASGKESENFEVIHYDGKGPHGALIIVECATNNPTRTVANIKAAFGKNGGEFLPIGSLSYMFNRKSVFEIKKPKHLSYDDVELELIDYGLSELEVIKADEEHSDEMAVIYGAYEDFGRLNEGIERLGLELINGSLKFIPTNKQEFSDEEIEEIEKLIDKLEEDDDVQEVYTNIA